MGFDAEKRRVAKLEQTCTPKAPLVIELMHFSDGEPPSVMILGDANPEQRDAITAEVRTEWLQSLAAGNQPLRNRCSG